MKIQSLFSPKWIKNQVKTRLFGSDVQRLISVHKLPDVEMSMIRLKEMGVSPKLVFDIGSYHGEFIDSCVRIWPEANIVGFEALPDQVVNLRAKFQNNKKVQVIETMVGDTDQTGVKFYSDENASSALYSDEVITTKKVIEQRMTKLDTFIAERKIGGPDFLQIDTLAFEYEILKGIEKNLPSVEAILVQLNFIEVFHNVKLAHEVIAYLAEQGFVIYDVCDVHRRPLDNALWQMDMLFVKKDSPLRSNKKWG
jgi:FkbM family methyltransferase